MVQRGSLLAGVMLMLSCLTLSSRRQWITFRWRIIPDHWEASDIWGRMGTAIENACSGISKNA